MWDKHKNKLIIVAVCLIAAVGVYAIRGGGEKKVRPDKIPFVCVETGKIYWIERKKGTVSFPLENPETHHRTLLPARQENGQWYVVRRYASGMSVPAKNGWVKAVDPETLRVTKP